MYLPFLILFFDLGPAVSSLSISNVRTVDLHILFRIYVLNEINYYWV